MASPETARKVRISKIAGRYLVFDIQDVVHLRRHHGICAVFTGTLPQSTTQNVFLGLPVELYAEEAKLLLDKGAAHVIDYHVAQLSQLKNMDAASKKAYVQSLRTQRGSAQRVLEAELAERAAVGAKIKMENQRKKEKQQKQQQQQQPQPPPPVQSSSSTSVETVPAPLPSEEPTGTTGEEEEEVGLSDSGPTTSSSNRPAPPPAKTSNKAVVASITPTTSDGLVVDRAAHQTTAEAPPHAAPLYAHLNRRGYYITPGLRFGGDYSVYPGDPFRYHAHFLATAYGWHQEFDVLDLVTSGRLGTAVKKSFLMGGQKPRGGGGGEHLPQDRDDNDGVRAFCVEWAGM